MRHISSDEENFTILTERSTGMYVADPTGSSNGVRESALASWSSAVQSLWKVKISTKQIQNRSLWLADQGYSVNQLVPIISTFKDVDIVLYDSKREATKAGSV